MTLLMRDSIDPTLIPLDDLAAVAGYADGLYQWNSAGWARFQPPIISLSIVINAANIGDILDVETGAASPADCPGWSDRFNRPGRRAPTFYVNRSNWSAVLAALNGRPADFWIATLDGTQSVPGAVAVQYRDFGGYDESVILDLSWLGLIPIPKEQRMIIRNADDGAVYQVDASGKRHVLGREYTAIQASGLPIVAVDTATANEIPNVGAPTVANFQPVLDAITVLKADLDSLTLKKA